MYAFDRDWDDLDTCYPKSDKTLFDLMREETEKKEKQRRAMVKGKEMGALRHLMQGNPAKDYLEKYVWSDHYQDELEVYNFLIDACNKKPGEIYEAAAERLLWIYHETPNPEKSFRAEGARKILLFSGVDGKYPGREELWKIYHDSGYMGLGKSARQILDNYETYPGESDSEAGGGLCGFVLGGVSLFYTALANGWDADFERAGSNALFYGFLGAVAGMWLGGLAGKGLYKLYNKYYADREAKKHGD
ncbi:hypothetical protein KY332_00235 [Candidatus Woesearchaeota archaeon]|nr:hypothetical protein [Candidatus Woesearchaeota archaeon]